MKDEKTYTVDCPKCGGYGWIMDSSPAANAFTMPICDECHGMGEIEYIDNETAHDNKTAEMEERDKYIQGTLDANGFVLR